MQKIARYLNPAHYRVPYDDSVIRELDQAISDMRRIRCERELALAKLRKQAGATGNGGNNNDRRNV